MKRNGRTLLLTLILIASLSMLISCELLEYFQNERHVCSFEETEVVSELSCTTDGIVVKRCICDRETTEITPATGHSLGEWVRTAEPSCTDHGNEERSCSVCGYSETRSLTKLSHNYEITEEIIEDTLFNKYTCLACGESFYLNSGIFIPQKEGQVMLTDCESSFSFVVISAESEEYIKEHLSVTELADPTANAEFTLTSLGDYRWLVIPADSYSPGKTYLARRSEGVFLEEHGFCELIFSVAGEDGGDIALNETIIYVGALEMESPGYYPYSVEYSDGSGEYFLSLEKADGLSVGDLICVGPATSVEDILSGYGSETFGRINSITKLNDGRVLIKLGELTAEEIFSALNIYESDIGAIETLNPKAALEERIRTALLSNPEFLSLAEAIYDTGLEFLSLRGLSTTYLTLDELIANISVTTSRISDPFEGYDGKIQSTASAEATVEIFIPATIGKEDVGGIRATLKYTADIVELGMTVQLKADEDIKLSLDVSEETRSTVSLDIRADVDYLPEMKLFVVENGSEIYHLGGCTEITGRTNDVTLSELVALDEAKECEICRPLSLLTEEMYLIGEDELYHASYCEEIADLTGYIFTERSYAALMADGYLPCESCQSEDRGLGSFETALSERIAENMASKTEDESEEIYLPESIVIGAFATTLTGVDREVFVLTMALDFKLEASTRSAYSATHISGYSYRETPEGIVKYQWQDGDIGDIDLAPSLDCNIAIYLCGFRVQSAE